MRQALVKQATEGTMQTHADPAGPRWGRLPSPGRATQACSSSPPPQACRRANGACSPRSAQRSGTAPQRARPPWCPLLPCPHLLTHNKQSSSEHHRLYAPTWSVVADPEQSRLTGQWPQAPDPQRLGTILTHSSRCSRKRRHKTETGKRGKTISILSIVAWSFMKNILPNL